MTQKEGSGRLAAMEAAHYPQSLSAAPAGRALGLCLLLILTGCASTARQVPTAPATRSNDVLMRAIGLVRTPYRYGGNTPASGFDCSGLVDFVFRDAAGMELPRSTRELIDLKAPEIDRDNLQSGDLVFFSPDGGRISHIGIYVGEGRFVHAPSQGGTVRLDRLDNPYWGKAYREAKRVLR